MKCPKCESHNVKRRPGYDWDTIQAYRESGGRPTGFVIAPDHCNSCGTRDNVAFTCEKCTSYFCERCASKEEPAPVCASKPETEPSWSLSKVLLIGALVAAIVPVVPLGVVEILLGIITETPTDEGGDPVEQRIFRIAWLSLGLLSFAWILWLHFYERRVHQPAQLTPKKAPGCGIAAVATAALVMAFLIFSCEAKVARKARLETEMETVWKSLFTGAFVNGYNPTEVVESEKVFNRTVISPDGKFGKSYICLLVTNRIPRDFHRGTMLGYPLDQPKNMQYEFLSLGGDLFHSHVFPRELFAAKLKNARTLVVNREHELRVWVRGYRSGSPLYEELADWYVTFIDLPSRERSHSIKFKGQGSNYFDKREELDRVLKLLSSGS